MGFNSFVWVVIGPFLSLWIQMGNYWSLYVFMGPHLS